ncbi:L-threonylcarbamoyladenylate synthase [Saxibacter everestensis]|uniref:L-threonylcarbamoyladenylate synthase n=1 Tax=Saxibacter everestensis TaxID=2909229 RepID=A0ABY8QYF0_9MICO|nr:L-threonylcarbamoyladenylate synthase [Brevibacteriaceae bacterium ZFBP1038]
MQDLILDEAARTIERGELIVLPTDTVYGVGADAFSADAVAALLSAKGRGRDMPPPVLIPRVETLDGLASDVPDAGRRLATEFWPGALTIICQAQPSLDWDLGDTHGTVAIRMPADDTALAILRRTGPLAVSSANKTGKPAAATADEARDQLGESVQLYLESGASGSAAPSTIVDATVTPLRVVRQGAITLDALRVVVPELLDVDGNPARAVAEPDAAPSDTAAAAEDQDDTTALFDEVVPDSDPPLADDAELDNDGNERA